MKNITEFINESKDVTFISKDDPRLTTAWTEGEKVLVMKYSGHHYDCRVWQITTIKKVNKASIIIDTENSQVNKFDKNGILKKHTNNKYLGKYDEYWVLYNADLVEKSRDIQELTDKGTCMWGFSLKYDDDKKNFKKELKNFTK